MNLKDRKLQLLSNLAWVEETLKTIQFSNHYTDLQMCEAEFFPLHSSKCWLRMELVGINIKLRKAEILEKSWDS